MLNLNAMPAARVVLDGRPLGFTPKVGMVVPAGTSVFFRWEDGEKHETATCAGGETKTVAVRLYDPSADDRPIEIGTADARLARIDRRSDVTRPRVPTARFE